MMAGDYTDRQVVIDLDALSRNFALARRLAGEKAKVMAVVKADAYGHGLIPVSRRLVAEGAAALGVGRVEEVEELRRAGLGVPVVILTGILPLEAARAVKLRSLPIIFDLETAEALAAAGSSLGRSAEALVKVDTGMGRLGFDLAEVDQVAERLSGVKGLAIRGLVSHLATADEADKSFALKQIERFQGAVERFKARGFDLDLNSVANSAGILDLTASRFDLVRPGIMLYGCKPGAGIANEAELEPVMTLKTRLIQVRTIKPGQGLSYGLTYTTTNETRIGVVPLGYGHGLPRHLSNQGAMLVEGQRACILGRVCMNLTILDLSEVPQAGRGDEVIALGRQGESLLRAEEMAAAAGTISYEVLCLLGGLNPRRYLQKD